MQTLSGAIGKAEANSEKMEIIAPKISPKAPYTTPAIFAQESGAIRLRIIMAQMLLHDVLAEHLYFELRMRVDALRSIQKPMESFMAAAHPTTYKGKLMNEPEVIAEILNKTKTIAIIGLSDKPERPSYGVARYLQQQGYRIVPVNPEAKHPILGEEPFASLDAACSTRKIDLVDVFRASVFVPEIVKDVMRLKIPYLWLQEGVCHEEAAEWAEKDGIKVVMDRCILKDHAAQA